jgi:hypothetical protein
MSQKISKHIENIVIGKPLVPPESMFAVDLADWESVEKDKTYFTDESFLPRILVELGIYKSVNEIRRNRKDLMITFDEPIFMDKLKVGKKRWLWILVGE